MRSQKRRGWRQRPWAYALLSILSAVLAWPLTVPAQYGTAAAQTAPAKRNQSAFVLSIDVPNVILSEAGAETPMTVGINPIAALPANSFLRVKGLPAGVQLTDGNEIAPGAWAIPIDGLALLQAKVPPNMQGKSEVTFTLFSIEGRILAEGRSAFVVAPRGLIAPANDGAQATLTAPSPKPAKRSAAPVPPPRGVSEDATIQAQRLLERGNTQIRAGSMSGARSLLERAVELGSAEAAMALAATYDAWELARLNVLGVQPDPELARKWYARAQELGASAAIERLARLPKQ